MGTMLAINGEIINSQEPLPIPVDILNVVAQVEVTTSRTWTSILDELYSMLVDKDLRNTFLIVETSSGYVEKYDYSYTVVSNNEKEINYVSSSSDHTDFGIYTLKMFSSGSKRYVAKRSSNTDTSSYTNTSAIFTVYEIKKQVPMQSGGGGTKYDPETDMIYLWDGTQWVEWKKAGIKEPVPLIPKMTSNTQPSGGCTASATYGNEPYLAFDDNDSTYWRPLAGTGNTSGSAWLDYSFQSVVDINSIKIKTPTASGDTFVAYSATLSYSPDGSTYQTIGTYNIASEVYDVDLPSTISAKNLRLTMNSRNILASNNYYYIYVNTLQAYE